ncbi:MAG: response regulator [Planctomycetes bacterium]|nr:response regulator [Planctomycetota bacterium]
MVEPHAVLVVDDNSQIRDLVSELLRADGFRVVEAADGVAALERLERGGIDVVVSDVEMPRLTGDRLCLRMREREELRSIPVILMSGSSLPDHSGIRALPIDGFVEKPIDPAVLLPMIRQAVRKPDRR